MAFSTYLANKILDHVLRNTAYTPPATVYLSIHTADPGNTGANECSGGSYARTAIEFSAAASKAAANSNTENVVLPACTPTHWGTWDASSGGNFLFSGTLNPNNVAFIAGDTIQIASAALNNTLT
jgi:hypothetical protein